MKLCYEMQYLHTFFNKLSTPNMTIVDCIAPELECWSNHRLSLGMIKTLGSTGDDIPNKNHQQSSIFIDSKFQWPFFCTEIRAIFLSGKDPPLNKIDRDLVSHKHPSFHLYFMFWIFYDVNDINVYNELTGIINNFMQSWMFLNRKINFSILDL